jgi:hypothetical protein
VWFPKRQQRFPASMEFLLYHVRPSMSSTTILFARSHRRRTVILVAQSQSKLGLIRLGRGILCRGRRGNHPAISRNNGKNHHCTILPSQQNGLNPSTRYLWNWFHSEKPKYNIDR